MAPLGSSWAVQDLSVGVFFISHLVQHVDCRVDCGIKVDRVPCAR